MPGIPLTDYAHLDPARREALAAQVADQTTLDRVLSWAMRLDPPARIARMVAQDEYDHDLVLPFDGLCLVYDAT